jgi:hypothetical protein
MAFPLVAMMLVSAMVPATPAATTKFVKFRDFDDATCTTGGVWTDHLDGDCEMQPDGTSVKRVCRGDGVEVQVFPDKACQTISPTTVVAFTAAMTMCAVSAYVCHRGRLGWPGTSGLRHIRGTSTH